MIIAKPTCKRKIVPAFTAQEYIKRILGASVKEQTANLFFKPFNASSFSGFWHYWNPLLGYYLYYYFYKPLSLYIPRLPAVWLTFFCCGMLHDLPFQVMRLTAGKPPLFTITTFFAFAGTVVVAGELFKIKFTKLPFAARLFIHALAIYLCWQAALFITT